MAMCRYRIVCRSQFDLVSPVGYYRITGFYTCKYLYAFTVVGS